jgi:hypothetical protein
MRFRRPEFDVVIAHDAEAGVCRTRPGPSGRCAACWCSGFIHVGVGRQPGPGVFTDRLQQRLAPDVAIYNRGVNGFGTAQEYLLMERQLETGISMRCW